jgi:hypothetical protein
MTLSFLAERCTSLQVGFSVCSRRATGIRKFPLVTRHHVTVCVHQALFGKLCKAS